MATIFNALYAIHPAMPALYLVIFANGIAAPTLYCVAKGIPVDISRVWDLVRHGSSGARYVVGSWGVFAVVSVFALFV